MGLILGGIPNLWMSALLLAGVGLLLTGGFMFYIWWRYVPQIARMFLKAPFFQPLITEPDPGGEDVQFSTADGYQLAGTYYPSFTRQRLGVVVFCHEFSGDRHSAYEYAGCLRDAGFDLFAFDFRNHGDSQCEPGLRPIHWLTDREITDLRAALDYLQTRSDRDTAGVGLFGVSRGGGAALCLAAEEPSVWAVATDGAFPTRSTMMHYVHRWDTVVVGHWWIRLVPEWIYRFAAATARIQASRRLGRSFPRLERYVAKIAPRPWLAIHGTDDSYVPPAIVENLVRRSGRNTDVTLWLVPDAKHNGCREVAPEEYRRRVAEFFVAKAPREAEASRSDGAVPAEHERVSLAEERPVLAVSPERE